MNYPVVRPEPPRAAAFDDARGDLRPTQEGRIIRREHGLAPVDGASRNQRDP